MIRRGVVVFWLFLSLLRPSTGTWIIFPSQYLMSNDSHGNPCCFTDTPSAVFDGLRDLLSCIVKHCLPDPACISINYHEDSEKCEFFNYPPMQSLKNTYQCKNYKNADSSTAVDYCTARGTPSAIPPQCCSVPFSFNGSIYNSCVNQGCYRAQRQWVTCDQSINFTAGYVKSNFTTLSIVQPVETTFLHGWLIIHFNAKGKENEFGRPWVEYKNGFGDLADTFYWYGNEKVFQLTSRGNWKLRVEVQSTDTLKWYSAEYESFRLSNEATKYVLSVSGYSGDAGDAFNVVSVARYKANGMKFTTYDKDNDNNSGGNCASASRVGWWFNQCGTATLTGWDKGSTWQTLQSTGLAPSYVVSSARMMIRPN